MLSKKSKLLRYYIYSLVVILLLFVLVFLSLDLVAPKLVKKIVKDYSESKDVNLSISNLEFDTKKGFVGKNLYLTDSKDLNNNQAIKIENFQILPNYLSSLKNRKLVLDKIKIGSPTFDLTGNLQNELKKLFTGEDDDEDEQKEDEEKSEKISVKTINIDNLSFILNDDYKLVVNDLLVTVNNLDNGRKRTNFKGSIGSSKSENSSKLIGKVDYNNVNKNLNIDFKLDQITNFFSFNYVEIPKNLNLFLSSVVNLGEDITSTGNLKLKYSNPGNFVHKRDFGNYNYDVVYSGGSKNLIINSSYLVLDSLLTLESKGEIEGLGSKSSFNIESDLDVENISFIPLWITDFNDAKLDGNINAEELLLIGSKQNDDLKLIAKGNIENLSFYKENFDKQVKGLSSAFNITKHFSKKEEYDFVAEGKLVAKYFEAKTVPVSNIKSDYAVKFSGKNILAELDQFNLKAFGGNATGSLIYDLEDGSRSFSTDIKAKNLNIDSSNNLVLKVPLNGQFEFADIKISSDKKDDYLFDIDFSSSNFNLDFKDNNSIKAEQLTSIDNLKIHITGKDPTRVSVISPNLKYSNFSYRFFSGDSGILKDLEFSLENNETWVVDFSIDGSGIELARYDLFFDKYKTKINIDRKGAIYISGDIDTEDGRYKNYKLYEYQGDFELSDNKLRLYDSNIKTDYFDDLVAEKTLLNLPKEGRKNFNVELSNITAKRTDIGIDAKIEDVGINFIPDDNSGLNYKGTVKASNVSLKDNVFNDLTFDFDSVSKNLVFKNLKAGFMEGQIEGLGNINFNNNPSEFSGDLVFLKPKIKISIVNLTPESARIEFSGNLAGKSATGKATVDINQLEIEKDGFVSIVDSDIDFDIKDETIYLTNGLITNGDEEKVIFNGKLSDYLNPDSLLEIKLKRLPLKFAKKIFYPVMPFEIQEGELSGDIKANFYAHKLFGDELHWEGKLFINDANFEGLISLTDLSIKGINGIVTLKDKSISINPLLGIMKDGLEVDKKVAKEYMNKMELSRDMGNMDYLSITEINYGFLNFQNIQSLFEINKSNINLDYFSADIYRGKILGNGYFDYVGDDKEYNLSFMFRDMSLESISDSIPSMEGYITGRFDGLFWINMGKQGVWTMNGPFSIWAKKSNKEELTIGRALLEKIGATGRFLTGSSRKYDKGKISGYIKEGFITFKKFEISNSIFGYKDLRIVADKKKNSISVRHMLSVIREIARRASQGGVKVDFNNEFNIEGEKNEN